MNQVASGFVDLKQDIQERRLVINQVAAGFLDLKQDKKEVKVSDGCNM